MVFTTAGKNLVRDWLLGTTSDYPNSMAVGTGSVSALDSDTALGGEVIRKSFSSKSSAPQLAKFETVLLTTDITTSTIAEFGLFNSLVGTSGTMLIRNTFSPIQKTNSIEVQFEQRVEVL